MRMMVQRAGMLRIEALLQCHKDRRQLYVLQLLKVYDANFVVL